MLSIYTPIRVSIHVVRTYFYCILYGRVLNVKFNTQNNIKYVPCTGFVMTLLGQYSVPGLYLRYYSADTQCTRSAKEFPLNNTRISSNSTL